MHPDLARLFGRWHEQALLDEAEQERLIVAARGRAERAAAKAVPVATNGNASGWRRSIGWAFIDLGMRLAGNPSEAAPDCQ